MTRELRLLLVAMRRHSRLPMPARTLAWASAGPEGLSHGLRYLPLVGALIGVAQALAYIAASLFWPHSVAVAIAIVVGLLATGAAGEIGLARLAGALASGPQRERMLAAIDDPRAGAAGTAAVAAVLILRFETLANIPSDWLAASLVCAQAFARGCAVMLSAWLPYARADGERDAAHVPIAADVAVAIVLALAPLAVLTLWTRSLAQVLFASLIAIAVTAMLRRMLRRRLSGYRAPALGAAQQVSEAGFYLGMLLVESGTGAAEVIEPELPDEPGDP